MSWNSSDQFFFPGQLKEGDNEIVPRQKDDVKA